ncbi:MAG: Ig-like domain-containing protein [Bacilli bacterium]|nr:Ig-like domain-containing protein [Bacilli bacterium]
MKNKKLIGLASLMLVLGAVGCGDKCKDGHTWGEYAVTKEATCTEAGEKKRTCTVCGAEDEAKPVAALKHDWKDDATGAVESTCAVKGSKNQTCSRCGATQKVDQPLKSHTWVDVEGGTPATCTEDGQKNQRCSVCGATQTVTDPKKGHDYDAEVIVTPAKCEEDGLKTQTCKVCGYVDNITIPKLNHNFQAVGGEPEAPEGEATVRVYKCANCEQTSLGFNANQPSKASLDHLVIDGNGGARFFGRPIGNALALDATTGDSVNKQDGECVYSSKETGDFFEYVFTLNAEQAALLSSCRCYCDATPADHLNTNDFWAYASGAEDWTSGFYIDGKEEHLEKDANDEYVMVDDHEPALKGSSAAGDPTGTQVKKGKRITDYRYVLYVDNPQTGELEIQEFDAKTKVPCEGNGTSMVRKEYVMPYTFKLHEGQNKISLRMAGGYRSIFHKFTFRPYVDPTDITVTNDNLTISEGKTVAIEGISETGVTFKSNNEAIATVDANGVVTGVKEGSTKIIISKEGNYRDAEVNITVGPREGTIILNLTDAVVAPAEGGIDLYNSTSSGQWYRNPKNGTTLTYNFQSEVAGKFDIKLGLRHNSGSLDLATNMGIKVNDVDVTVAGTVQTQYDPVEYVVGQANLNVGANTMVISFPADSALYIKSLKLSPAVEVVVPPTPVHEHTWGTETAKPAADGAMAYGEAVCECGAKRMSLAALGGTFAEGSKNKDSNPVPPDGFLKLASNTNSISYKFNAATAGKVTFAVEAVMDNFQGGNGSNNSRTLKSGKANDTLYNITFKIDYTEGGEEKTNDVDMTAIEDKTYDELFDKVPDGETPIASGHSAITTFDIGTANVGAGLNTLTIIRNGSYNFIIRNIYIIF